MEFATFRQAMINIPAQIVRSGRRLIYRLFSWNAWQETFFRIWISFNARYVADAAQPETGVRKLGPQERPTQKKPNRMTTKNQNPHQQPSCTGRRCARKYDKYPPGLRLIKG
jgi:hypothetical protein